jgi:hypothetical protein
MPFLRALPERPGVAHDTLQNLQEDLAYSRGAPKPPVQAPALRAAMPSLADFERFAVVPETTSGGQVYNISGPPLAHSAIHREHLADNLVLGQPNAMVHDMADIVSAQRMHAHDSRGGDLDAKRLVMRRQQVDTLSSTRAYSGNDRRYSATPPQSYKQQLSPYSTSPHIQIGDVQLMQEPQLSKNRHLEAAAQATSAWETSATGRQGSRRPTYAQWDGNDVAEQFSEPPRAEGNVPRMRICAYITHDLVQSRSPLLSDRRDRRTRPSIVLGIYTRIIWQIGLLHTTVHVCCTYQSNVLILFLYASSLVFLVCVWVGGGNAWCAEFRYGKETKMYILCKWAS